MTNNNHQSSSSSSSTTKNDQNSTMNYELIIESSAIITETARITVNAVEPPPSSSSSSSSSSTTTTTTTTTTTLTSSSQQQTNVKVIISHGNVFHPYSKLIINIPLLSSPPPPSSSSSSSSSKPKKYYELKIGENNLFEEECVCVFDIYSEDNKEEEEQQQQGNNNDNEDDGEKRELIQLLGSYNQFTPKCKVRTKMIGNGNIFHSYCNLYMNNISNSGMKIGNGNIFNSFVNIMDINDDDEMNVKNDKVMIPFQNQVLFNIVGGKQQQQRLMQRTNDNGVRKNMAQVRLLLGAGKSILQTHHKLQSTGNRPHEKIN